MRSLIVGGTFGEKSKRSGVVDKLHKYMGGYCNNGIGDLAELAERSIYYNPVVWMPNVSNEEDKIYPRKATGAVLICSKMMRDGYSVADAVSRIFSMHANAVIAITKGMNGFEFKLIDALGNTWVNTVDIMGLYSAIMRFFDWSVGSCRIKTEHNCFFDNVRPTDNINELCDIVKWISDRVVNSCYERYFGNASTRCMKMFPSEKLVYGKGMFVSRRNVDKRYLSKDDFIYIAPVDGKLTYGTAKPSVDSPVQMQLYHMFDHLRYMIHGHAYVTGCPVTRTYYPCGDMREVEHIAELIVQNPYCGVINLKKHGFLMYAETIDQIKILSKHAQFESHYNIQWD